MAGRGAVPGRGARGDPNATLSRTGSPAKRKEAESQRLRTAQGYKEYRTATDNPMGAPVPQGLEANMTLTGSSDLKTAFDMLDERKEGALDRTQARKWLRCAGWCVTDETLDDMLNSSEAKSKTRAIQEKRTKWGLRQLTEIAESNRERGNSSVEEVQR